LELCAEPFHLAATRHGALAVRLLAEAASTFSRAGVVAWLLLAPSRQGRPLAVEQSFAAAHCAGAAALLLAYAAGAALQPRAVWPGAPSAPTRASLLLLRDFSAQALWKLALAEGDKAVLLAWRAPDATGVYGLASNLGGLAARILLQPLEEAAYAMFAASAAGGRSKDALAALLRVLLLVRPRARVGFAHSMSHCCACFCFKPHPGLSSSRYSR
jgi:oligosaccharide translocation protein RFT1